MDDYDRGFLELLGQLTSVGNISREAWSQRWKDMKRCNSTYYVIVIEDTTVPGGLVIGAATMRGSLFTAVEVLEDLRMWWFQISTEASNLVSS